MFDTAFQKRVKELARGAGLAISDLKGASAKLKLSVRGHEQPLFIIDYDGVWEFSCPSFLGFDDASEFPQPLLAFVLEQNSRNKRGFWCIEELGGKKRMEVMHNIAETLLTPDEFGKICWAIVKQVEALEEAFKMIFGS